MTKEEKTKLLQEASKFLAEGDSEVRVGENGVIRY